MERDQVFSVLYSTAVEYADDLDELFDVSIGVIQYAAVEKNIEFDGYFRTKWEIEAENVMTFDDEYFENEQRSELYVYLAALVDKDTFDYLEYVWELVKNEKLTENVLHREIYFLKEKGVGF